MPPKKSSAAASKDKDAVGNGNGATGKKVSDEDAEPVILEVRAEQPSKRTQLN
jgi:hypothetical protein